MRFVKKFTAIAGVATFVLCLGACAPAGGSQALFPIASQSEAPSPKELQVLEGDTNGDGKLSEFEKQINAKNALRDYVLPDGSVVSIDPKQPLPVPVIDAVQGSLSSSLGSLGDGESGSAARDEALSELINQINAESERTGKGIMAVYLRASEPSLGQIEYVWATTASNVESTGILASPNRDEIVAAAQSFAADRGYELIVVG